MKPVDELLDLYKSVLDELTLAFARVDLRSLSTIRKTQLQANKLLQGLDKDLTTWITTYMDDIHKKGIKQTLKSVSNSTLTYEDLSKSEGLQALVKSTKENSLSDLQMITQNLRKKVSSQLKRASSEMLISEGSNEPFIRKQLLESLQFGMVDTAGRKWKPLTYAQVVGETQLMNMYRDTLLNTCLLAGIDYAVISSHGATDSCQPYEGKIVKLRRGAVGNYEVYNDVQYSGEIFHIHCKHVLIPISSPDEYPADISTVNNSPSFESKSMGLHQDY